MWIHEANLDTLFRMDINVMKFSIINDITTRYLQLIDIYLLFRIWNDFRRIKWYLCQKMVPTTKLPPNEVAPTVRMQFSKWVLSQWEFSAQSCHKGLQHYKEMLDRVWKQKVYYNLINYNYNNKN